MTTLLHNIRLLVCGGRNYTDRDTAFAALNAVHRKIGVAAIIEGICTGADELARQWARQQDIWVVDYPAEWEKYGRRAGPLRNQQMIEDGKPDAVLAFPGGRGTADMVDKARRAGIPVWVVEDLIALPGSR